MSASGHETKPPARYTEATLIKELEDREIGRPSTYASIIKTIIDRGYVYKKGTALVPAWLAFSVTRLLEEHFARLVSYEFTAGHGGRPRRDRRRPQGARPPSSPSSTTGPTRSRACTAWSPVSATSTPRSWRPSRSAAPDSGIVLRVGRYGPYLEGPDDDGNPAGKRANVPEDLPPDELTLAKAKELFANPAGEEIDLGEHPETGLRVVAKNGRFGPYVTEVLPEDAPKSAKPRTGSLFKSMTLDTITLEDAVKLLSLPRVVGTDAEGVEITAQNGRYGPYLKKGTDSRSIDSEEQLLTITLDEALAIYAQPKQRGRAAAGRRSRSSATTRCPGSPIVVKAGRFGEYVTDGEYNATLRKDDSVEAITLERAAELLAERRAKGPAKKTAKRGAKKSPAKKTAKKTAAKKTTKKTAKKATAKKG